jgi:hypothetical protein
MLLAYDPATNPLNNNEWAFPLFECIHIAAFAMSVGTIAIVDLRLLGLGLRHQTAAQLVQDTMLWTSEGGAVQGPRARRRPGRCDFSLVVDHHRFRGAFLCVHLEFLSRVRYQAVHKV